MELNEHDFLEELLALRRETTWNETLIPTEIDEIWSFDENPLSITTTTTTTTIPPNIFSQDFTNLYDPICGDYEFFTNATTSTQMMVDNSSQNSTTTTNTTTTTTTTTTPPSLLLRDDYYYSSSINMFEDDQLEELDPSRALLKLEDHEVQQHFEFNNVGGKLEGVGQLPLESQLPVFNMGITNQKRVRGKKPEGQPSKNLMAERRRRKRLNDRLSMLRSIVPKISKMDRTSIVGDTIDYMKELLEKIRDLQQEMEEEQDGSNDMKMVDIFKNVKANETIVRNSPKFEVERRNEDTRIEICCAGKPGLLLSTVNSLEALGIQIQQCVISSFNDFAMQASCSEDLEQRNFTSCEEIKQTLFRNAGYGGRCL